MKTEEQIVETKQQLVENDDWFEERIQEMKKRLASKNHQTANMGIKQFGQIIEGSCRIIAGPPKKARQDDVCTDRQYIL